MWGTSKFSLVDQSGLIAMMGQFLTLLRWDQCCKILKEAKAERPQHSGKALVCSGFSCWNDKAGNSSTEWGWGVGGGNANWAMHNEPYADPCIPDTAESSLCSGWQSCFPTGHVGERWRTDSNWDQVGAKQGSLPRGLLKLSLLNLEAIILCLPKWKPICCYAISIHLAWLLKTLNEDHSCYLCAFGDSPTAMAKEQRKTTLPVATPATGLNGGWCQLHSYRPRIIMMLFIGRELYILGCPFVLPFPHIHQTQIQYAIFLIVNNTRGTFLQHEDNQTFQRLCKYVFQGHYNDARIFCSAISSL